MRGEGELRASSVEQIGGRRGRRMTGKTQGLIHEARAIMKKVLKAEMTKREKFRNRQLQQVGFKDDEQKNDPVLLMVDYLNALKANNFKKDKCEEEDAKMREAADKNARDAKINLHKRLAEKAQRKNMVARVESSLHELKRKSRSGG